MTYSVKPQDSSSITREIEFWLQETPQTEQNREIESIIAKSLFVLAQGDFQARWDVAKLIPKLGNRVVSPLIAVLEDENADLEHRWFAGRLLGEFDQPEVIFSLMKILESTDDPDLATITANSLANVGSSAINTLADLLKKPESRLLATRALAQIRRPQTVEPLLTVITDDQITIRATAIEALSSFSDERIIPILIDALKDTAPSVRKEGVIGLGCKADLAEKWDLLTYLDPLLYDINLEVCQQTAIAISKIAGIAAQKALFTVLKSPHTPFPLQITLIQTLGWRETSTSLDYLYQALSFLSLEAMIETIRVMGRIENPSLRKQAGQYLLQFFESDNLIIQNPEIKQTLAHTWGQLNTQDAKEALQTLSEDEYTKVRLHAIAALKQLALNSL